MELTNDQLIGEIKDDGDVSVKFARLLHSLIEDSYANHSRVYQFIEEAASLLEIVKFVKSVAGQPATNVFLHQWLPKIPDSIAPYFHTHLREEEDQDHAGLARELVSYLSSLVQIEEPTPSSGKKMAERIAYPFLPQRVEDKNLGYFLGCFLASEALSTKRSRQLFNGFRRNGIAESRLEYLKIHIEADSQHSQEVGVHMIIPALRSKHADDLSVLEGAMDRLSSTTEHILWYEENILNIKT